MNKPTRVSNMIFRLIVACAFLSLAILLVSCQEKPTGETRQVEETHNFELLWTRENIFIPASNKAIYLAVGNQTLFLYGNLNHSRNPHLIGIDIASGKEVWTKPGGSTLAGEIMNMSPNGDYAFIGYNGTGKAVDNSLSGAGKVAVHEIDSGAILWTQTISGTRKMATLAANNFATVVDGGSFAKRYYLLDSTLGNPIETMEKGNQFDESTFSPSTSIGFLYDFTYPISEDDGYWEKIFRNSSISLPPIVYENIMALRTENDNTGYVKVYDVSTGDNLWSSKHVAVGNPAIGENAIFSLTQNAKLIAQDIETGNEIGFVQLSPSIFEIDNSSSFVLAAKNDTAFVYFGDSQQLFAFRFMPKS